MEKKLLTPKDLKKQKQEAVTEPSKSTDNEPLELELRPWSDLPVEILERISSYLFLADRVRFPTVCKNWQAISIPNNRMIEPPWFVSLSKMDGICTLYDTSCGRTYQVNSPKLIGASIQSSKFGWLLLSKSSHNVTKLFFFNPLRADSTIDLPALPLVHSPVASFSASPISSNCLVCVVCPRSPHDSLAIYIHSEDQTVDWLHFNIGSLRPFVLQLHSPVVCHGLIYCIGHGGKVGILNTRNSLWIVAENPMVTGLEYEINFFAECDGEVLLVSIPSPDKPIQVLKLDIYALSFTEVVTLQGSALFVSPKGAILTRVGTEQIENKIHYPVFGPPCRCDHIEHYCMDAREYHPNMEFSLPMEIIKFLVAGSNFSWAWLEPKP